MRNTSNHIYRLVWSGRARALVVASEHAGGRGRSTRPRRVSAGVLMAAVTFVAQAGDLPTGGRVVAGNATIVQSGDALTVTQTSARMAADWQSFSIAPGRTVQFVQPSSSAAALNRVTGADPSVIQGALRANGQVFLVNPNGVMFTPTARVDVGGLVASTLAISNDDFMAGRLHFSGDSRRSVVNAGRIDAAEGGTVALIAARIENTGQVSATSGNVLMGAGARVRLDLGGPVKIEVEQGAIDALVTQGGAIRADGGLVYLTARAAGDLMSTVINHSGTTEARTLATGRRGEVFLMGDMSHGRVVVGGTIDASAPQGGDGGFVETSAAQVAVRDGVRVTTIAPRGRTGQWLIDPTDFTVYQGDHALDAGGIGSDTLSTALATSNMTLATGAGGGGNGDIFVNGPVTWNAATGLTLRAHGDIHINADITASHANGQLQIESGQGVGAPGDNSRYVLADGVKIRLQAGPNFATKTGTNALVNYQVITTLGSAGSVTGSDLQGMNADLTANYALGADIDASTTAGWNAGAGFDPVGVVGNRFTGQFAGLGNAVSGLRVARPTTDNIGLFGWIGTNGGVRDVSITGANIAGQDQVGLLAGVADLGATIAGVSTSGVVSGQAHVGGLAGMSSAAIARAGSAATVSATGDRAGGLVGILFGTIDQSRATGSVSGTSTTGGLSGSLEAGAVVTESYATGNVSGTNTVGGLVGFNNGSIARSFATGAVTASADWAGGLVGGHGAGRTITNAYATGNVTAASSAGGLVGQSAGVVTFSYASGAPVAPVAAGGLIGSTLGGSSTSQSFWDTTTSGTLSSDGGTGKTTAEMRQWNTFLAEGWSIANQGRSNDVWRIYEGGAAPMLRNFFRDAVTVTPNGQSRQYDGTTTMPGTFAVQAGADASLVRGTPIYTAATRNVGTHAVTLTGVYSNQLEYDLDVEAGTGTIMPRVLTVTGITARDKVFDGTTAASLDVANAALPGVVGGENVLAVTTGAQGSFADSTIGTGKPVTVTGITITGSDVANYTLGGVAPLTASILAVPSQEGGGANGGAPGIGTAGGLDARGVAAIASVQASCGAGAAFANRANCGTETRPFTAQDAAGWPSGTPIVVMDGGVRMP